MLTLPPYLLTETSLDSKHEWRGRTSPVPKPSAGGEGRSVRACAENYRHSGNSVALAYTSPSLNYRNVGNFGACMNPRGRPGNEARAGHTRGLHIDHSRSGVGNNKTPCECLYHCMYTQTDTHVHTRT